MTEPAAARCVLAWDLGTSGAKAGLVAVDGQVLGSEVEPLEPILLPGGGAEQRPEDWWDALVRATQRLLARDLAPRKAIVAISVTAQWSGTVAIDANGRPLHNAIIWMDSRGAPFVQELVGGPIQVLGYSPLKALRWIRLTGGAPAQAGKDSLAHILYLKNRREDVYGKTHKFLEPKDYLNSRLCGQLAASYDSIAMHWVTDNRDATNVRYDERLLRACGLERRQLPELHPATDVLGQVTPDVARELGLEPDVVVVAGTPDVHSAAIGAGTTLDFAVHLYVGTSSWISAPVPRKGTDVLHNMAALPAPIRGRYLLLNDQETAGACLNRLLALFYAEDELGGSPPPNAFELLDRVAARAPAGSRKLIFLPWLYGERTPVEDRFLRGAFFNYSLGTERAEVVRSVYEGVAYNTRWLFEHVEAFIGKPVRDLRFIGGGARSNIWSQIFADVLGRPLRRVRDPLLANLRGAGLLAFVALGDLDWADIPERVAVERTFEPDPRHRAIYSELFAAFRELHRRNRSVFARLNRS